MNGKIVVQDLLNEILFYVNEGVRDAERMYIYAEKYLFRSDEI